MQSKFNVNDRVYAEGKGNGTIIELAASGEFGGGKTATEFRYRVKWDNGPRTWFRQSALSAARN